MSHLPTAPCESVPGHGSDGFCCCRYRFCCATAKPSTADSEMHGLARTCGLLSLAALAEGFVPGVPSVMRRTFTGSAIATKPVLALRMQASPEFHVASFPPSAERVCASFSSPMRLVRHSDSARTWQPPHGPTRAAREARKAGFAPLHVMLDTFYGLSVTLMLSLTRRLGARG